MKIEKIKIIDNIKIFDKCGKYDRIYFGNEFCDKKMPTLKDLRYILSMRLRQKVTLVFPYLTQSSLEKIKKLFVFINRNNDIFDEIVFNDWGLFYFLRNNYSNIKLALGRLLTKQKTDPFAFDIINNMQKITASQNNIFIPKKVSKDTAKYFRETFINSKNFAEFMLQNNIVRVELDNVNWNIDIKLPEEIKASVYYPYVKITTTRFCGTLNMLSGNCLKQCKNFSIKLSKYRTRYNYIIKGNVIMYKNKTLPFARELQRNHIDRIIINE